MSSAHRSLMHWAAVTLASAVTAALVAGAVAAAPRVAPEPVVADSAGLASADWRLETPAQATDELHALMNRETAVAAAQATVATVGPVLVTPSAAAVPAARRAVAAAGAGAATIALDFALQQRGKPYLWGATGPQAYDCSGLTQSSYAQAGVTIPRTSVSQAQAGTPVRLDDLRPGDLVFWAYHPADLSTIHHVALYLGGGQVVQAPKTGDVVKVSPLWLSGYAGAVRVATPAAVIRPGPASPAASSTPSARPTASATPPVATGTTKPVAPSTTSSPTGSPAATDPATASATPAPSTSATPAPSTSAPSTSAPSTPASSTPAPATPATPTPSSEPTPPPATTEPAPAPTATSAPAASPSADPTATTSSADPTVTTSRADPTATTSSASPTSSPAPSASS